MVDVHINIEVKVLNTRQLVELLDILRDREGTEDQKEAVNLTIPDEEKWEFPRLLYRFGVRYEVNRDNWNITYEEGENAICRLPVSMTWNEARTVSRWLNGLWTGIRRGSSGTLYPFQVKRENGSDSYYMICRVNDHVVYRSPMEFSSAQIEEMTGWLNRLFNDTIKY